MSEKVFVNGIIVRLPSEKTPWIKYKLSVKPKELIECLRNNVQYMDDTKTWMGLNICESREGKLYIDLDTYKKPQVEQSTTSTPNPHPDDASGIKDEATGNRTSPSDDYPEGIDLDTTPF